MIYATGEPLALDLVNTRAGPPEREVDTFDSVAGFAAWLSAQAGRLTPPGFRLAEGDLAAVRALRDHVRAAVEAARHGTAPPAATVEALNQAARAAPTYPAAAVDGTRLIIEQRRDADPLTRLLAELSEATMGLVASPEVHRVRMCEGPGCRLLFLPANPRRRWCSPARCGNRVRVARHYQRKVTGASGG